MIQRPRFAFRPAVKRNAKLRFAVAGPGGSGKTYTLLKLATLLGGRIAAVDTEHGSMSKYADLFQFDVMELDSFDPAIVPDLIAYVAAQGYSTLITDSWSHFWMGEGGELDQVDAITARSKSNNSFAAWRHVSPKHNRMIDAMLSAPIHILVSMRTKNEWVVEKDERTGKTAPRKIGLAPVMRDGVEYEFDVCGDMDVENTLAVTKSRCPALNGKVIQKPGQEIAEALLGWLGSSNAPEPRAPEPRPGAVATFGQPPQSPEPPRTAAAPSDPPRVPWTTFGEMKRTFLQLREIVGETEFLAELARFGWKSVGDIRSREQAAECYERLVFLAERAEDARGGE
jgi:hypothetical protein